MKFFPKIGSKALYHFKRQNDGKVPGSHHPWMVAGRASTVSTEKARSCLYPKMS